MRVAAFRKAACNPTSKQPSSLIVFGLLEMFSRKYLTLVSSPWKPWKLYGGSSKKKVRSPKHFCFPFLLPTYHGEEVDKLLSPQDHLTHQALCAHMVLPQQHPHVQEETKLQFLLRMPLTHLPKPCCHCKKHWIAWEGEFPPGQGSTLFLPRKGLEKTLPSQGWHSRTASTSVVWPPLVGSTQQDTEPRHQPATNGDPTQVIKPFFIIIMPMIIFTHTTYLPCTSDSMPLDLYTRSPARTYRDPVKNS